MVDYSKGKIYKIVCNKTGKIYIGSTTSELSKRLSEHKRAYKWSKKNKNYKNMTSYKIIEGNNFNIILIEEVNCKSKEELLKRERFYIENIECVNKIYPLRTKKEYYNEHETDIKEYIKQYKEDNKDKLKDYIANYYQKNKMKCRLNQKQYNIDNKDKIKERKKQYYQNNKEKINEKNTVMHNCPCGSCIQKREIRNHLKSKKHIAYVQSLNVTN